MDRAHELGINFFDTANAYGPPSAGQVANNDQSHAGWTEEILGDWFAKGGGRREKTVLATKLYGDMGDWPNEGKLSALNIRRACDASLRRLQTDYIDLYQMHHVDRDTPWDEIWQAMEIARRAGQDPLRGAVNFAGWHIAQAEPPRARGFTGLVSEQSLYNLATRGIELEVLPAARPTASASSPGPRCRAGCSAACCAEREGRRRLAGRAEACRGATGPHRGVRGACAKLGDEPANVALAWLLHQHGVTAPIIGPRTPSSSTPRSVPWRSTSTPTLARLDEIFPGYKTAPEHYAW